jgi:hypothetical protein
MQILFQRVRFISLRQLYFTASILFHCVNFILLRQFYFTASILCQCVNFILLRPGCDGPDRDVRTDTRWQGRRRDQRK